jgi:uncharacterized YccA/Bax inhibitor family protein
MAIGMSNPVLNENRFRPNDDEARDGWAAPNTASSGLATARPGVAGAGAPPTGAPPTGAFGRVMSVGGTVRATLVLWALILVSGAYGWSQVTAEFFQIVNVGGEPRLSPFPEGTTQTTINAAITDGTALAVVDFPGWVFLPMLAGFAFAMVAIFKPRTAPFVSPLYALAYGVTLGAISAVYEFQYSGIVLQAILATLGVFGVMLFLYASRIIKVTRRFAMVVVGATFGILVMYLVGLLASVFGVDLMFYNQPNPLGIGISVVICIVAALNLALDFSFIENATEQRMPAYMNWLGALGITVTIVWLYLELLRLIALTRR